MAAIYEYSTKINGINFTNLNDAFMYIVNTRFRNSASINAHRAVLDRYEAEGKLISTERTFVDNTVVTKRMFVTLEDAQACEADLKPFYADNLAYAEETDQPADLFEFSSSIYEV